MLHFVNGRYQTAKLRPLFFAKIFPSIVFYLNFLWIVLRSGWVAWRGKYDDKKWEESSNEVLALLESIGLKVDVEGLDNIATADGPVVFIGNHMSMMETLLLPSLILPFKPTTYVIKQSLLEYPVFKYVMKSRNPIAVTRTNPRQDLKIVLSEGEDRLQQGISVIVFPQTTRAETFDPAQMSTIGVKLAQKSDVNVIPIALKTDSWRNGHWLKDFGRIDTRTVAHFAFGEPLKVEGKGATEQEKVNKFITEKLKEWQAD